MTSDNAQLDHSSSFWISKGECEEIFETEFLSFDPYDPRRVYEIIRECVSRWLIREIDSHADAMVEFDVEPVNVASEVCRTGFAMELGVDSARIGIAVVGRFESAHVEDRYLIPVRWSTGHSVCAVLPILVMQEDDGAVNVFLHGWALPGGSILSVSDGPVLQEGYDELDVTGLEPLDTLFDHLQQRFNKSSTTEQHTQKENRTAVTVGTFRSRSIGALGRPLISGLAIALVSCVFTAMILRRNVLPAPAENVSFDLFTGESVRGTGDPSVSSGQSYDVNWKLRTNLKHGWLFQFDSESGQFLSAGVLADGTLNLQYSGVFNETTCIEYFVAVLSDRDSDVLHQSGTVTWLDETRLKQLQSFDAAMRDSQTEATLGEAIRAQIGERPELRIFVHSVNHID